MVTENFNINNDIPVFYVKASSFPAGVKQAWEKLHALFPDPWKRKYYGISWQDANGNIIYKAATAEEKENEGRQYGCESYIVRKGIYTSILIHDFMKDIPSVGRAFQQLLTDPGIDPQGACIEIYEMPSDVRCLVRLNRTEN